MSSFAAILSQLLAPEALAFPDPPPDAANGVAPAPLLAEREEEASALDLSVGYTADTWRNARGGRRKGWRYLDNLDVTLAVDAERALGWAGASLFVYGLYNNGESLSDELVGDLQVVSNIDAGTRAARLYEAWIEQRLAGDRLSLKAGLYDLNSEFDTTESGGLFLNSSHGIGPDFSQTGENGPSIFPVTSLAFRAEYSLSENLLLRTAVLDGVPGDPDRPRRTAVKLSSDDGALLVAELNYLDERAKVAVGSWRYTARFEDTLATAQAGEPVERKGNQGFYMLAERKLTREHPDDTQGLSGWVRLGFADTRFNPIGRYVAGGLVYTGPFPGRDEDQAGLALSRIRLGSRYRRAAALAGEALGKGETNIELTYRTSLTPWLTLQPNLQYVISPGVVPGRRDALVLGIRTELGF